MDDKSKAIANDGVQRVIELVLQKLKSKQSLLKEISEERIGLIMAGLDGLDLSWVASQESVDQLIKLMNVCIDYISKLSFSITKNKTANVSDLAYFSYTISSGRLYIQGINSLNINVTDDIIIYGSYDVNTGNYSPILYNNSSGASYFKSMVCNSLTILPGFSLNNDISLFYLIPTGVKEFKITGTIENSSHITTCTSRNTLNNNIVSIDLGNMDLYGLTDMHNCFKDFNNLKTVKMTGVRWINKTSLANMFENCTSLEEVIVSKSYWDMLPSSCNTTDMFKNCGVDHVTYID